MNRSIWIIVMVISLVFICTETKAQFRLSDSIEVNTSLEGWEAKYYGGQWGAPTSCNYVKSIFDRYEDVFPMLTRDDLKCGPFIETGNRIAFSSPTQTSTHNISIEISVLRYELNIPFGANIDSIRWVYLSDDFVDSIFINKEAAYGIDTVHYGQFPVYGFKEGMGNALDKNYLFIKPGNHFGPFGTYFRAKIYYSIECTSFNNACIGDTVQLISTLNDTVEYDSLCWIIHLHDGPTIVSRSKDTSYVFSSSGYYNIDQVVYRGGGSDTLCYGIEVLEPPEFSLPTDTSVCDNLPLELELFPISGKELSDPLWSTGEMTDIITIYVPGTYWLRDSNMCGSHVDHIEVSFKTCKVTIDIPTIFTPNEDGYNDFFAPFNMNGIEELDVVIYSRWGECVYSSSGTHESWDGTMNGKKLPEATYYWIIKYSDITGARHLEEGTVMLTR